MRLTFLEVPYDSGHFGQRMGGGPLHLLERGLAADLERRGHDVRIVSIRLSGGFRTEVGSAVEIHRLLAPQVAAARSAGRLPFILAGNCNASLGALAALPSGSTGVVWLDAHGDFNTPDISPSGFFDGMALTVMTGLSWRGVARTVPGFEPVSPRHVVLVGARDLDAEEERLAASSGVSRVRVEEIRRQGAAGAFAPVLDDLARQVPRVHFHVDLDVLDPSEARANAFAVPGGLRVAEVLEVVAAVGRRFEIAAASFSAYDPDQDPEDRAVRAASEIAGAVATLAER